MINESVMMLIGGLGTRLRSLYPDRPKALVPVGGKPFIAWLLEWLRDQQVCHVHLAAGYRADQVTEWAAGYQLPGLELTVSIEPAPLGTAGGIKYAQSFIAGDQPFFVMNGDSLLPHTRLANLLSARRAHPSWDVIIAAVEMTERGQYGTVDINSTDHVTAFREKADNAGGWVNGGIYLIQPGVMAGVEPGVNISMEKEVFPVLASSGKLGCIRVPGPLLDMGTPAGLQAMEQHLR